MIRDGWIYPPWMVFSCLVLVASATTGCGDHVQENPDAEPARSGAYLGEPTPGALPAVFAPGLISTQHRQRDTAVSPDGRLFLYTLWGEGRGTLIFLEQRGDGWTGPEVAPFSGVYSDIEPFFHPAGGRLYFASKRPLPGESEVGDWNLWFTEYGGGTWTPPAPLQGVNEDGDEYYPAVTSDGTIYFTADREDSLGGEDIYRAREENGNYGAAENLGPAVNSKGPEFNAFVSPDGELLLFSSVRDGDQGGGDLYASFLENDAWTPARNLGPTINGPALDYCPFVSPDGKILFFSSMRAEPAPTTRRSYDDLMHVLDGPVNGQGSIYWVEAGVLDGLAVGQADAP
jgi:Tol biopolymer transport system component